MENFIIGPMTPWGPFVTGFVGLFFAFVLYGLIMKYPAGYFIINPYKTKAKNRPTKPVTKGPHGVIGPIIKFSIIFIPTYY